VGRTYITLDDQTVLDAAQSDPAGFIRGLDRAIIDEIQRAPDLLLAIKKTVDEDYRPGRFLLTASANGLTLPRVADSLAGRIETIQMLPLARAEIAGRAPTFLERLFAGKLQGDRQPVVGDELVGLALLGGFPEAISRESERRRRDWARSYLTSVLTRDLRDIAEIEKLTELPKFVRLLAEHSGQLVNYSQFGSSTNVSHKAGQGTWPARARCGPSALGYSCNSFSKNSVIRHISRFRLLRRGFYWRRSSALRSVSSANGEIGPPGFAPIFWSA
jgi:hypothetical protein